MKKISTSKGGNILNMPLDPGPFKKAVRSWQSLDIGFVATGAPYDE